MPYSRRLHTVDNEVLSVCIRNGVGGLYPSYDTSLTLKAKVGRIVTMPMTLGTFASRKTSWKLLSVLLCSVCNRYEIQLLESVTVCTTGYQNTAGVPCCMCVFLVYQQTVPTYTELLFYTYSLCVSHVYRLASGSNCIMRTTLSTPCAKFVNYYRHGSCGQYVSACAICGNIVDPSV